MNRDPRKRYVAVNIDGRSTWEHIVVAERALGRPLPDGTQVHHVDGDRRNNAPSNLVICQDIAYHRMLHSRAAVVKADGDPNTDAWCTRCLSARPRSEFYTRSKGYKLSECKSCLKVIAKAKREALVASGRCVKCGKPAEAYRCGPCQSKHHKRAEVAA